MKTIHLHFRKTDRWLWLIVWSLLLLTGQVRGQIYSGLNNNRNFYYYDIATNTWTAKAGSNTAAGYTLTLYKGNILIMHNNGIVGTYNPTTNTWSTVQTPLSAAHCVGIGDYVYAVDKTTTTTLTMQRYDPATNTVTQLAGTTASWVGHMAYDGSDYIYVGRYHASGTGDLLRYSISSNSWTTLANAPNTTDGLAFKNGKLYIGSYFTTSGISRFSAYDPVTNTYTVLASAPVKISQMVAGDGNYLYGGSPGMLARYDISTDTWTNLNGTNQDQDIVYLGPSCAPTATATATQATCASGGGVNANAALTLSSYSAGVTKVGYSAGSTYTGPAFASATAVTTAPMTLANILANPVSTQPYTIRVFQDATCYQDILVTLAPKVCLTANLILAVSPPTQSGAKGEQLTYTFTLTNAGPDTAPEVTVDIPIPKNTKFSSATASQGSYNSGTAVWDVGSVAVGSQTITVTLEVK